MNKLFSHTSRWALTLMLCRPAGARAAEEEPLAAFTPHFAPMESMAAIGKLLVAFLIIGALMTLLFKGMKKMGLGHGSMSKAGLIAVLDTRMIAPKKYITVVRVAGEDLAIGISDNNISLLCKLGPQAPTRSDRPDDSDFDVTLTEVNRARTKEAEHV